MNQHIPKREDLKVFITSRQSKCNECKEDLGKKAWITLAEDIGHIQVKYLFFSDNYEKLLPRGKNAVKAKKSTDFGLHLCFHGNEFSVLCHRELCCPRPFACYMLSIMPASLNERFNKSDIFSREAQHLRYSKSSLSL